MVSDDGRRIDYRYDGDHLVEVTGPGGARVRYDVDAAGQLTRVSDADGYLVIANDYDGYRRVVARARRIHYELVPVYDGMFRNQGAVMTKAALDLLGLPGGPMRAPLLAATEAERRQLAADLAAGGVKLPGETA